MGGQVGPPRNTERPELIHEPRSAETRLADLVEHFTGMRRPVEHRFGLDRAAQGEKERKTEDGYYDGRGAPELAPEFECAVHHELPSHRLSVAHCGNFVGCVCSLRVCLCFPRGVAEVPFNFVHKFAEGAAVAPRPRADRKTQIDWSPWRARLIVYREMFFQALAHHWRARRDRIDGEHSELSRAKPRDEIAAAAASGE